MKIRSLWITLAAVGATSLAAACGGGSSTAEGGAAASGGEPALVITDQAEWDTLSTSGKESFDRACGTCHPGGDADLGPAIKGHSLTMADMTKQIREGSGRMQPVDETKLPEAELKGVMVYLATIAAVGDVKGP
jgi:mono/diheme cytochrome c family protein